MSKRNPGFSDEELLTAIRSDTDLESPIRFMYDAHFSQLAHLIRTNQGNQEDAEDTFQEALVLFIDLVRRGKFRGESSVRTFLYGLMRNLWLNQLRKRQRGLLRDTEHYEASPSQADDAVATLETNEIQRQVWQLFDQLAEGCRQLLVLFYYEQRSMKEIEQALHYQSEQVARNKKYRCMKQLSELLDDQPALKSTFKQLLTHGT